MGKAMINNLVEILRDFDKTAEEIKSADELYEYSFWDSTIANCTKDECEEAFNLVYNR